MNLLILGTCMFSDASVFFKAFGISSLYFFIIYALFGSVAMIIKNRYPAAGDLFKRVSLMLPVFYAMNIGSVHGIYFLYQKIKAINCQPVDDRLWWTILYGCIMSTVITFINEGMAAWEKWKDSLSEGEKLQNAYQRSKLFGLKGQINPHFLFNCFNTLSGLIQEDEKKAEEFLDEMTKVHRYLLGGDDEYLVKLSEEMKFVDSYMYLTKARFGQSIRATVDLPESLMQRKVPPLSMQVILENIIYTNALSKNDPLTIHITGGKNQLIIKHTLHEKTVLQHLNIDEGLDNLINKYRLLNAETITVRESTKSREIILPLFTASATA
jgi:sensor histidine kinase YesM